MISSFRAGMHRAKAQPAAHIHSTSDDNERDLW
jgi:hypothetical protein